MAVLSYDQDSGAALMQDSVYHYFSSDNLRTLKELGKENVLSALEKMVWIRHLETRGEQAYSQGKVGGFYHSYSGQEAIQTACIMACGTDHWYTTTYRCHALAFLLGVTPEEIMAELYGRSTGNAGGRGGSMHLYTDRMLGGLAIVGGHIPIAAGAAFAIKYRKEKERASFCFLGDGATVQGAFHETMNMAALWNLPLILVIENNRWGMGTAVERAVCVQPIAENFAKAYGISSYTLKGMDYLNCYEGFQRALQETLQTSRPVLIEAVTERFRGHSISDPGLYRSKDDLKGVMEHDPILQLRGLMIAHGLLTEEEFHEIDRKAKERMVAAMKYADESPWPDPISLEEGVFAPEGS